MSTLMRKISSALRIARLGGVSGVLQAIGRNLGAAPPVAQLDESHIAWMFFSGQQVPGTMVDVGAHHGGALRPFVQNAWRVFAFEPDASNRALLMTEFEDCPLLKIDPRAVSDQARLGVQFYRSDTSSGISSLSAFDPSHRPAHTIDVTTLAELVASAGITGIDFLKIDTEGHDLFALRGLPWQQVRPRLVLCKYENRKTEALGYRYEDLVEFLLGLGYLLITSEWYPIERYGTSHRWRQFSEGSPPSISDGAGWGNIFAVQDAVDMPTLRALCAAAAQRERTRVR